MACLNSIKDALGSIACTNFDLSVEKIMSMDPAVYLVIDLFTKKVVVLDYTITKDVGDLHMSVYPSLGLTNMNISNNLPMHYVNLNHLLLVGIRYKDDWKDINFKLLQSALDMEGTVQTPHPQKLWPEEISEKIVNRTAPPLDCFKPIAPIAGAFKF